MIINSYNFAPAGSPYDLYGATVCYDTGTSPTSSAWEDSSANNLDATGHNSPTPGTEDGHDIVAFVTADVDYYAASSVPKPTTSNATFIAIGKIPSNNAYTGITFFRGTNTLGLVVGDTGGNISYEWLGIYGFAGVTLSSEVALYAVVIASGEAKVYKIDSGGTTLATNTTGHSSVGGGTQTLEMGRDSLDAARSLTGKFKHFEYHADRSLSQAELENIYNTLV